MKRSIARWTTILAAATIVALPVASFAQTAPQTQPPAQTEQQPAPQTTAPQAAAPQTSATDDAAKIPLTAARNSLSQLTQLPAASQLQGETRAQVSQLIANFNELITTKSDWKASYAKVEANLSALLNQASAPEPERASATPGAVGTSGTATLDPAIRAKLVEFRQHLDEFEKVVTANEPGAAPAPAAAAPPTAAPASPASPASPTTPNPPETPATPTPETPAPAEPRAAATPDAPAAVSAEELMEHVDAIESILSAQTGASAAQPTGTATATQSTRTPAATSDVVINQTQLEQLKAHLAEMRRLLEKK